ncbi:uncharacterized protein si:ch211-63p21.1 isoform X1 [Megalops cyprinoides]|uniref:uncharacterized protein si:ch211-63p21.1 isoform X1 n=1 Tax=Megalops cyprinoides TaxID=118141 RepID=UPI001864BB8B|nr:uncharacterized protein si:ch211-63p21.1 isoform X1 [Megalops cyprinoides]
MKRRDSDSDGLCSSGENPERNCEMEMGTRCAGMGSVCGCGQGEECVYEQSWCTHCIGSHTQTGTIKWDHCEKHKGLTTRYSEGYGTEEECVLSDPQGESDADADIEDTDSRLQEGGSLQRISSRRRRRQRVARQDTTESEDDGGRSHRAHRWSLRLSPHRAQNRPILEESVSQVRPLVLCRPCGGALQGAPTETPRQGAWSLPAWPLLFLILPVSVIIVLTALLLPLTNT